MKKILLWTLLLCLVSTLSLAQNAKKNPPPTGPASTPEQRRLKSPLAAVPPARNPFGISNATHRALPAFTPLSEREDPIRIVRDGLPILFEGKTAASGSAGDKTPAGQRALAYFASLQPEGIADVNAEFVVKTVQTDEQGNLHVHLQQVFGQIPVYGGEMIAHTKNGVFEMANGRYYPSPRLGKPTPAIPLADAEKTVVAHIGPDRFKTNWTAAERQLIGGESLRSTLVVYHPGRAQNTERLAWHIEAHPNLLARMDYFVDAQTGDILHHFDHTCHILPTGKPQHLADAAVTAAAEMPEPLPAEGLAGPVTATGLDLQNVNRSFGAWMDNGVFFLEDGGRAMFNNSASQMPGSPVGAIVTLDALNTSPQTAAFDYDFVKSNSSTFNNKTAVSAHWNAIQSYEYYRTTFSRNSIDGVGGSIFSLINVTEPNSAPMDNAFWNGNAMFYGSGNALKPLAGGLDVGGHEMTHGVIEKLANLEYQNESGALNESFADVFAAMIDRDDWKIGEDIVKPGTTASGCLRDMLNPEKSDPAQPNHLSQKFTGQQDNGGVHINSGIPNRAFALFANAIGKDKAEQVYYKALRDYLVKSSQFIDCRIAVIQAASDLYGASAADAAGSAFTTVGILGGQSGGNYLGQLSANPGDDLVLAISDDGTTLRLLDGTGKVIGDLYDQGIRSRPSISDNGAQAVFVNDDYDIIYIDFTYTPTEIKFKINKLSIDPVWRNAAISKDGRFLAALSKFAENRIYITDLADPLLIEHTFFLYNPTYSESPQTTSEVKYADVLEFDYSGEFLMYDAFNEFVNSQGEDISYWDIGFLQFWENNDFVDGAGAYISKLFNGLPDNTSVANPTLAKNSPYIIAFDVYDGINDRYDIYGANVESGDYNAIVTNNFDFGWPNYNRLDNAILFQRPVSGLFLNLYTRGVSSSKIQPQGNIFNFAENHQTGVWFSNGNRSLMVGADEAAVDPAAFEVAPNPATEGTQVRFRASGAASAQIDVLNLLGETLHVQQFDAIEGENNVEVNLQGLPAGAYVLRLRSGKMMAAKQLLKM